MNNGDIFDEKLVAVSLSEPNRECAIRALAKLMLENGCVTDSYLDAVLEREKEFPTGLSTAPFGVALPHTDCEHVKRTGIAVGVLSGPIEFHAMDDPDETVEVKLIFLMAIRESGMMVEILQKLAEIFQKPDVLEQLSTAANPSRVVQILKSQLSEVTT
jgi:PTS system galactitol-specific IIA component